MNHAALYLYRLEINQSHRIVSRDFQLYSSFLNRLHVCKGVAEYGKCETLNWELSCLSEELRDTSIKWYSTEMRRDGNGNL